jgi:hypothetical protein
MAINTNWTAAFEDAPAAGDQLAEGDNEIRTLKEAIRQHFTRQHYMTADGDTEDGAVRTADLYGNAITDALLGCHKPGQVSCLFIGTTSECNDAAELTVLSPDNHGGELFFDTTLGTLKYRDKADALIDMGFTGSSSLPGVASTYPFHVERNSTQSIITGQFKRLKCNSEIYDPGNVYDVSSGDFDIPVTGAWLLTCGIELQLLKAGGQMETSFRQGEIAEIGYGSTVVYNESSSARDTWAGSSIVLNLTEGDAIAAMVMHDHGSSRNISGAHERCFFSGHLLSVS